MVAHGTEVDYDAVDEAALPMVAQTSLPQAADQFRRAYRQLLIYDHEEYENEYHYDNLGGSLIASSVTQTLDPDGWLSVQHSTLFLSYATCLSLGYSEGSAKLNALLSARDILGRAINRLLWGAGIGAAGLLECIGSPLSVGAGLMSGLVALGALSAVAAGATVPLWVAGIGALGGMIAAVCLLVSWECAKAGLYYGEDFNPWHP